MVWFAFAYWFDLGVHFVLLWRFVLLVGWGLACTRLRGFWGLSLSLCFGRCYLGIVSVGEVSLTVLLAWQFAVRRFVGGVGLGHGLVYFDWLFGVGCLDVWVGLVRCFCFVGVGVAGAGC